MGNATNDLVDFLEMFRRTRSNFQPFSMVFRHGFINNGNMPSRMDSSAVTMLAIATAVVILITFATAVITMHRTRPFRINNRSTNFLDDGAAVCGICFGELDGREAVCGCGKRFHDDCARPTGSCPYCNAAYEGFEVTSDEHERCPNCGGFPRDGVCRCGAVVPKDGVLVCICGSVIDARTPVCKGCGTEYVMRTNNNQ